MTDAAPRRWGFGVGIAALILGILTGIGAIGWGVYSIGLTLVREARTAQAPLLVGEPGTPMPTEQTACDDPCFGVEHLWESRLTAADFERLGTAVVVDPAGTYADSTATEQHELGITYWDDAGYSPDSCLFTASEAPVIIERGAARDTGGTIHWLTSFESESRVSGTARALRFFPTAEAAQQHLRTLHELVPGCTAYGATDISAWRASVTPMPALELPPTVAAVGWVESSALQGRYYAVDLLRSNAVLRLVLWTDTEISEQAFRDLAD